MKIKGMLFIVFAACVGHIGAMEPDKKAGPKQQGMQQGTTVPALKQLAAIAKAKDLIQKIHSAKSPQQAIDAYRTVKTSDFLTLPRDLQPTLLAEIGRQYYISYGEKLETGVPWGLSIQDYLTSPALQNKIQITTTSGKTWLDLKNMSINDLSGLQNIPNIGTVQKLSLRYNQLITIQPNAFAGLANLDTLSLAYNLLTTIKPNAFAGLTNLTELFLENNPLTTIPPNAFTTGLTNLTVLVLHHNQLTTIQPNAFAGLTKLRELYLNKNQLTTIQSNAFAGLPNLKWLYLEKNPLTAKTKESIRKALPGVKIDF